MSHFSVLVIGEDPEKQLAPYHEFECTGHDDEFVQDIDVTEDRRADWETDTIRRLKDPSGILHSPYDRKFYRDPTPEEEKEMGKLPGSGCTKNFSFYSEDWNDGDGYKARIFFVPDGFEEIEIPMCKCYTFLEYLTDYCEISTTWDITAHCTDDHKYQYAVVVDGKVQKVINRTNPNAKWDWYGLGGRYEERLTIKTGEKVNQCLSVDVDWPRMKKDSIVHAEQCWEEAHAPNYKGSKFFEFGIEKDQTREEYILARSESALFAVVKDGKWHERGEMGWWACVSNEKDPRDWNREFEKLVTQLPNNTLLSVYDCHI
jgi:hypothetical protein